MLTASTVYFTIAAAVTALIFGLLIALFVWQMNRRFLTPMLRVMGDVEALDWTERGSFLPPVQNEEFDSLIDRINDMLARIEGQSDEIITAQLRAKNAELQKQKAIIFSLKRQINAHFVINTLSAIRILLEQREVEQAATITNDLSALIRYAYEKDDMIGLWNELQMLKRYTSIMNVRYANKIDLVFDVDDRLMDVLIPRMLLQPIVENAILHGFKNRREGCEIRISAMLADQRMQLSVHDNGAGITAEKQAELRQALNAPEAELPKGIESIALINIWRQLHAHYGAQASLDIQSSPGQGTTVVLTVRHIV